MGDVLRSVSRIYCCCVSTTIIEAAGLALVVVATTDLCFKWVVMSHLSLYHMVPWANLDMARFLSRYAQLLGARKGDRWESALHRESLEAYNGTTRFNQPCMERPRRGASNDLDSILKLLVSKLSTVISKLKNPCEKRSNNRVTEGKTTRVKRWKYL